jgi:predicted lipoprotein with Yx(FWY)xxD motif
MLKTTIVIALVFAAAPAFADPAATARTAKGPTLVDSKGMTLYTFDLDSPGKSACNGGCAANWPPLAAPADARPTDGYTVISRDDGGRQWAYKGKPLYGWAKDSKPGDINGDGLLNDSWHVAQP